jgi:hypothetical protein
MQADSVAAYLAAGGRITRCPTAAVAATGGTPSAEDQQALALRREARETARQDAAYRRRWGYGVVDPAAMARWLRDNKTLYQ